MSEKSGMWNCIIAVMLSKTPQTLPILPNNDREGGIYTRCLGNSRDFSRLLRVAWAEPLVGGARLLRAEAGCRRRGFSFCLFARRIDRYTFVLGNVVMFFGKM